MFLKAQFHLNILRSKQLTLGYVLTLVVTIGLLACNKPTETISKPAQDPENWLLGQWVTDNGEDFKLDKACQRPDSQFGKQYAYWRGDVDGDPYEELDKVEGYVIEGKLIKAHVLRPTSYEAHILDDGYMHFERQSDGSMKMIRRKFPNHSPVLFKCPSSPIPYSADVAPTPPKYDNIEPGIVERPRS
ncbi:MAG TPA: hypothetical protein VGE55_01145 [Limnobacter sp.]|uniref:hypothetical protein n=1 Tax=Limnobacter sp. TaxID=2003368 RepID=UPI002EDBA10A